MEIHVELDITGVKQALLGFVSAYNETINTLNDVLLFSGILGGDRSLAAARSQLIRALEEPVPGGDQEGSDLDIRDIGLEVQRGESREVSELTLRRLALSDISSQSLSPLPTTQREASILQGLNRLGIRQEDDGTLQVDLAVLEENLQERPEVVTQILQEDQESVFPRLDRELSSIRDTDSGILARRRRLFQTLQDKPWQYFNQTQLSLENEFEILQNTQKYQSYQLLRVYQNQFGSEE